VRLSRGDVEEAELGLAPLIDVVLLLLIFFLVTTSFATPRIPLELPGAASAEPPRDVPFTVVLTSGGGLFLDDAPATLADLEARLVGVSQHIDPAIRAVHVHIHGVGKRFFDGYGVVGAQELDRARARGVTAIGIAVDARAPDASTPAPD